MLLVNRVHVFANLKHGCARVNFNFPIILLIFFSHIILHIIQAYPCSCPVYCNCRTIPTIHGGLSGLLHYLSYDSDIFACLRWVGVYCTVVFGCSDHYGSYLFPSLSHLVDT